MSSCDLDVAISSMAKEAHTMHAEFTKILTNEHTLEYMGVKKQIVEIHCHLSYQITFHDHC